MCQEPQAEVAELTLCKFQFYIWCHMPKDRRPNISQPEHEILCSLNQFYFLSAPQVQRLHYSPKILYHVQTLLKSLSDKHLALRTYYLKTSYYGHSASRGKTAFVYSLSSQAQRYLRDLGIETDFKFNPEQEIAHSNQHLLHTLALNDFLISAKLLPKAIPQVSLEELRHERQLKREADRVTIERADGAKEQVAVIPDGWLDFSVLPPGRDRPIQFCIALERDRGSTEQKAFRQRIRARVAWSQGAYQKHFGTTSLTTAYVVSPAGKRLADVRKWAEAELEALGRKGSELFLFTDLDPATASPQDLFLSAYWYEPFKTQPVSLINALPPA